MATGRPSRKMLTRKAGLAYLRADLVEFPFNFWIVVSEVRSLAPKISFPPQLRIQELLTVEQDGSRWLDHRGYVREEFLQAWAALPHALPPS